MAEKKDLTKLSKVELVEMLHRQDKMLQNRRFIKSLPDKGEKICRLIERIREQIALREQAENLTNRFKKINLAQQLNARDVELDSDDEECNDDDDDDTMVTSKKANYVTPKEYAFSQGRACKKKVPKQWAYDSAVTQSRQPAFEKAKVLSLEESRQLQLKQKEEQESLKAKEAAEKLMEQINWSSSKPSSTGYEFSSKEAKMKYRKDEDERIEENEPSESDDNLDFEQEQSDEFL